MLAERAKRRPKDIYFDDQMNIVWKDGTHSKFKYWDLRTGCPCAACVNEITGEKMLDDNTVDPNIHPIDSSYVGNYAIQINWSDGHSTGMFTFKELREFSDRQSAD